jgi:septum formation protein
MAESWPFRLILASTSSARRYLLSRDGYSFTVIPSNVDEPLGEDFHDPRALVAHIAGLKAAAVARTLSSGEPTVVLAADSLGWHQGLPVGKAVDRADARRILTTLMGTRHQLWTGVCLQLLPGNMQVAWQEASTVAMSRLSDADLEAYLDTGRWEGCSGAYAVQESGTDPLVSVVEGTVSNVIGLPMETLERVLAWLGRDPSAWPRREGTPGV